ncbi:MAG: peptidylprolyl isomerase [Acidimicrobiales bacterium]|jgi:putative peptide maturation system protein|nr:peptidylprolyl isomerase [Acidimicrobiales bacterium]
MADDLGARSVGRVGGREVSLAEALYTLKISDRLDVLRHALDDVLLAEEAAARGISADDGDLQAAADAFRRSMGLLRAAQTEDWLAERSMSVDDLEEYLRRSVVAGTLRREVVGAQVEAYFTDNRPQFDVAELSRIVCTSADTAALVHRDLAEGTETFASAARFSVDHAPRGYVGDVRRFALEPAVAEVVFGAAAGDLVGPVETDGLHHVLRVERIDRARLDEGTHALVEDLLFDAWLADRRAAVGVVLELGDLFA